ncbi:MAG: DUF2809 domain-containing protein [Chitinophagaceae bacterium]|jgi:DNA integrity scanning protein DisA with diadenylate cyclase activity|nr:DUF2809 domain-containing protein [Chitinophagaceae bacterium]
MQLQFNSKSFLIFLAILAVEIFIGAYVNDAVIRPFGGDFLVVFLVYYFVKTFIKTKSLYLITAVVLFAYLVEFGQYFHLVDILGVKNKILRIAMGNSFSWGDMLAYTLAGICCYFLERKKAL